MRRAILTGAILVSALGVALGTGIPAAHAQRVHRSPARRATFPVNVCVLPAKTPCMNDWNGDLNLGSQAARFYHYGNSGGNNRILVTYVNTISGCGTSGGFQPFTDGAGLNCDYNGRPVYRLQWAKNGPSGVCIAGYDYSDWPINDECSAGAGVWFVYSKYSALISVGGSNAYYADSHHSPHHPVWVGTFNGTKPPINGQHLYLTTIQSWNLPWGFNTDGG